MLRELSRCVVFAMIPNTIGDSRGKEQVQYLFAELSLTTFIREVNNLFSKSSTVYLQSLKSFRSSALPVMHYMLFGELAL